MPPYDATPLVLSLLAPVLMTLVALHPGRPAEPRLWRRFRHTSTVAWVATLIAAAAMPASAGFDPLHLLPGLAMTSPGAWTAVLAQFLGTVIGVYASRYLAGEPGQAGFVRALAGVLAGVHLLLLANHWLVLIPAWAGVGLALNRLLLHYPDRPFARLAAHKKFLADRTADALLIAAAALAWHEVGSGSFDALIAFVDDAGATPALQASALCVAMGVALRTALLPVHGWLTQVMEAPTPVSALLHAGVVNLGGYVLIRLAPLLESAPLARGLLVGVGLATAVLAGLVMLTRISIKVRLAWSTVAQMGFMILECGLGLYTLAMLHLLGHSLYKAQAFLSSASDVRGAPAAVANQTGHATAVAPFIVAPLLAGSVVIGLSQLLAPDAWPLWWSVLLAFAWAPLLWPGRSTGAGQGVVFGLLMVAGLTSAAALAHHLPWHLTNSPQGASGLVATAAIALLYAAQALVRSRPAAMSRWRHAAYAGLYLDEVYTRLALKVPGAGFATPSPTPRSSSRDRDPAPAS